MDFENLDNLYIIIAAKGVSNVESYDGDLRVLDNDPDRTGCHNVLSCDHLYGLHDLLMAHRAAVMKLKCAIVPEVRLRNIQRHSSLDVSEHEGERMAEHVEQLRPEYERRIRWIHMRLGRYHIGPDGEELDA
jgi:hypothetical protein